ncbi:helix-turn-helix domain-containing protein [Streptomyces avermitilis]
MCSCRVGAEKHRARSTAGARWNGWTAGRYAGATSQTSYAAARLHMTRSPLTRVIQRWEAEPGATLPHRSAAGVTLNASVRRGRLRRQGDQGGVRRLRQHRSIGY